jgi:HemX protein
MVVLAHVIALFCYAGAALLAALPFVRPTNAPVRGVLGILGSGVTAHLAGLVAFSVSTGQLPLSGLGPSLSTAGFLLALSLLLVEWIARDVSLTLVAAPLAALPTLCATIAGLRPGIDPEGVRGVWMVSHVALSFVGIAAFATAAAAGTMYLVQRHELKSRRFGAIFRVFPPLATLDRVNHVSMIAGWLGLTLGVVLAISYAIAYHQTSVPKATWAVAAWLAVTTIALGRTLAGWQARRAALLSSVGFVAIVLLYVALRLAESGAGRFL